MTIEQYINEQTKLAKGFSCDYQKVSFRNAIRETAQKMAEGYTEQYKNGLISWSELGEKLVEISNKQKKIIESINEA